jgi:hypothetical protein
MNDSVESRPSISSSGRRVRLLAAALVVALALAVAIDASLAQFQRRGRGGGGRDRGGGRNTPARIDLPPREIFPGNVFTFCTVMYYSNRREPLGFGWGTDYPDSGYNFMLRLQEFTTIPIARHANGEPRQVVLRLTDPELFKYPYIFTSDVGTAEFDEDEREALRNYLLKGGFFHVDDFWGSFAWRQWEYEIGQVLPPEEFPIVDIPMSHPIFHIVYEITEIPQVPSIQYWRRSGGNATSEQGPDSDTPHMRGIFDANQRLMVLMTHNTDIADGWEKEREDYEYFAEYSVKKSYPLGINIVVYAMTH